MKKNTKILLAIVALVAVVGIFLGVYFATRPQPQEGEKAITVVVVHKDGTEKTFQYRTDEEFLDKVLLAKGLIEGYEDQYGLVIEKVDGESAIWNVDNAFWALYVGDAQSNYGISQTPVEDGVVYKLVYEPIG